MIEVVDGARQLASVNMDDLNNGIVGIDSVRRRLAPDFLGTFKSLLNVMAIQESKERAKQAKQVSHASSIPVPSGPTTLKRTAGSQGPEIPAKRARPTSKTPYPRPEPRTPDQPTHPHDPDFTGASSLSAASKDEETTKKLPFEVLGDTMSVLEADFRSIKWHRSSLSIELFQT